MLAEENSADAKLAADATLIFTYREISSMLKELVRKKESSRQVKLNVVYALGLRPDKEAISLLINLLDDDDTEVANAAETALQEAFGIPVGSDKKVWRGILDELKGKSRLEIIRGRVASQLKQMDRLRQERQYWKNLYFELLDKDYERADTAAKGIILTEKLGSEFDDLKIWAIERLSQRSASDLPPQLTAKLFELISDNDRAIRLATATVLSKMSSLNPAEKLLEQFEAEQYEDVKLAIFEALGEACYYAFSPGSEIKLDPKIRNRTLELAGQYLNHTQPENVKKGAEVIRKLLALNGLDKNVAVEYLKMIAAKYQQHKGKEGQLQAELISVMARLCAQGNFYKDRAAKLFEDAFVEALPVTQPEPIRISAAEGLINIDKSKAFAMFKDLNLNEGSSVPIREVVLELSREIGTEADLNWIMARITANDQGELAWRAMLEILERQDATVIAMWAQKLKDATADEERVQTLLEMAKKKEQTQTVPAPV